MHRVVCPFTAQLLLIVIAHEFGKNPTYIFV